VNAVGVGVWGSVLREAGERCSDPGDEWGGGEKDGGWEEEGVRGERISRRGRGLSRV